MVRANNVCGVGVAYDAKLAGNNSYFYIMNNRYIFLVYFYVFITGN